MFTLNSEVTDHPFVRFVFMGSVETNWSWNKRIMPPAKAGCGVGGWHRSWGSRPASRDYSISPLRGFKKDSSSESGFTKTKLTINGVKSHVFIKNISGRKVAGDEGHA